MRNLLIKPQPGEPTPSQMHGALERCIESWKERRALVDDQHLLNLGELAEERAHDRMYARNTSGDGSAAGATGGEAIVCRAR